MHYIDAPIRARSTTATWARAQVRSWFCFPRLPLIKSLRPTVSIYPSTLDVYATYCTTPFNRSNKHG